MGQLDSLPRELLYLILEHCTFEDCKNLRATCKYISGLTIARVFETYRIAFFQSHLDRFVELSSRPEIAACIKRLVFVGDVLPEIDSIDGFNELIDMREPWSLFSKKYIEDRITVDTARMDSRLSSDDEYDFRMRVLTERQDLRQAAYKEYNCMPKHTLSHHELHHHFEQYAIHSCGQDVWGPDELFYEALARLPNLTSVENAKHGFADNHLQFPWKQIKKDIILTPDNWMQLNAVEVDDDDDGVMDLLRKPVHMKHANCLLAAIGHRAASSHASPLKNLRLVNVGGQPFLDLNEQYHEIEEDDELSDNLLYPLSYGFGSDSELDIPEMRSEYLRELVSARIQGLAHLERLELDVTYTDSPFHGPQAAVKHTRQLFQEINTILSAAARSLKTLRFQCRDDEGSWALEERAMNPEDDTIAYIKVPLLPQLESLRLSCNATESSLTELLRAQSKTLRCLELVDCDLNMGTWNSVLRQVPEIFETGLQRIYLEGLHDEDYPRDSGDEALFEDGLDVGEGAHPHDRAILKYLLHGGEMPELDFNSWYERNRELADRGITEWEDELLDSEVP